MQRHDDMDNIKRELSYIQGLIRNICTFKKIVFDEDLNWTQDSKGYFNLKIESDEFVPLAAYEAIGNARDKKLKLKIDTNFVTINAPKPCEGYLVVAAVKFDNEYAEDIQVIDRELDINSFNAVSNNAVTKALKDVAISTSVIPDSLPASDVYSWAKQEEKPCYEWNEICCKPTLVQKITYGGKSLRNNVGAVALDEVLTKAIAEELSKALPELKLSDFINDLDFSELENKIEEGLNNLKTEVSEMNTEYSTAIDKLASDIKHNKRQISALEDNFEDASRKLRRSVKKELDNFRTDLEDVRTDLEDVRTDLERHTEKCITSHKKIKSELNSNISALAYKCRVEHQMLEDLIHANSESIAELQANNPTINYQSLLDSIGSVTKAIKEIKQNVDDTHIVLANSIASNTTAIEKNADGIAKNAKDIAELSERVADNSALEALAEKVKENKEAIESNAQEFQKHIKDIEDAYGEIKIPTKLSEFENDLELTQVTKSDINGNIKVNGNEIEVYRPTDVDVPTKLSQLENDTKFITRKEASGLVASAQVNFDTAFIDDDLDNVTYIKTVNIANSQGSVLVNGDDIVVKIDGLTTIMPSVEKLVTRVELLEETIIELRKQIDESGRYVIVDTLPLEGKPKVIYAIRNTDNNSDDKYIEYMYVNNEWEIMGASKADMADYLKKTDIEPITENDIKEIFNN